MAGADGQQLPPLRDLSRRAASFLRMARLVLTGAAAPAQLLAGEEAGGGHSCDPYYKSVRTEDDWESELWLDGDDESELLVDHDEDAPSRTSGSSGNSALRAGGGGGALNKKSQFTHAGAGAASGSGAGGAAAAAETAEPLMPRRAAKRANDAVVAHHPFGCDRQGSESSSLLLVSS